MKSKVHPRYKTKYRVANWAAYNQALVRRGDVTLWLSSEAIAAWTPRRSGRRGGQRRYSDLAIETALTLRLLYHLPLRQAEGFLHALFGMMRLDLSAPDSTTLSRRSQHLRRRLRLVPPEQEDVIRVHTLTEATGDDATTALDLLTAVEGPVRLEFPILSLNPGLRQRCVAPGVWPPPNEVRSHASWRCCMNTRCGWGGVARTSRDPPQEPHYGDEVEGSSQV